MISSLYLNDALIKKIFFKSWKLGFRILGCNITYYKKWVNSVTAVRRKGFRIRIFSNSGIWQSSNV